MEKVSKNHVLPPPVQEENDKQAILNIIETYDIDDAIAVLYNAFKDIRSYSNNIDKCITVVEANFKKSRKTNTDD